jgi:IS5 family transposase
MNQLLSERVAMLRKGTILDATIINALSSTKNKNKGMDPELHLLTKSSSSSLECAGTLELMPHLA